MASVITYMQVCPQANKPHAAKSKNHRCVAVGARDNRLHVLSRVAAQGTYKALQGWLALLVLARARKTPSHACLSYMHTIQSIPWLVWLSHPLNFGQINHHHYPGLDASCSEILLQASISSIQLFYSIHTACQQQWRHVTLDNVSCGNIVLETSSSSYQFFWELLFNTWQLRAFFRHTRKACGEFNNSLQHNDDNDNNRKIPKTPHGKQVVISQHSGEFLSHSRHTP